MELSHPQFKRITINPQVCTGKPCIRGLRFPVTTLLGYLASGMSASDLLSTFPFLEHDDIKEALGFAALTLDEQYIPLQQNRA
jgi:uncharacterized protein (DUF433 family)